MDFVMAKWLKLAVGPQAISSSAPCGFRQVSREKHGDL